MNFNLNNYVRVKLKQKGIEHLVQLRKEEHSRIPQLNLASEDDIRATLDRDGYLQLQGWSFIDKFGGLFTWIDEYIDIVIIIEDKKETES